jgi:hypothetical protein
MTTYIKRIQSRLNRMGIKKSLAEVREVYTSVVADKNNPTEEEITAVIESFLPQPEPVEETAIQPLEQPTQVLEVENHIQPAEEPQAEEDSIRLIEENDTPLEESNLVVSNQDKHSEITLQADQMGITLTEEQISVVASDLDNQFEDEDEFISEVKSALIAFIDYQTKQSNTKFNKMLGDVEDYAESKQHQRFENMTTNLKQFSTRLQDKNNFFRARQSSIVAALHSRIPK